MPILYTIDSDKGGVVVRFTGTVRAPDLFTTFRELYEVFRDLATAEQWLDEPG